jgi:4-amino-4-deoxy-L-arabinose transferase-like glycosyltransferase
MNKIIAVALILASIYYLMGMVFASQHTKFSIVDAVLFLVKAAYYLLAAYAALRLLVGSGK